MQMPGWYKIGLPPEKRSARGELLRRDQQERIRRAQSGQPPKQPTSLTPVQMQRYLDEQRKKQEPSPPQRASRHKQHTDAHEPIGELGPSRRSRKRHNGRGRHREQ